VTLTVIAGAAALAGCGGSDKPLDPRAAAEAYQHCAELEPCSVWIVNADGGEPRQVRFHWRLRGGPEVERSAVEQIDLRDIDGSDHRQLTSWDLGGGDHPVFSPDGRILLRSFDDVDSRRSDFWIVRPDGGDLEQLTRPDREPTTRSDES
jgi:hypothetical protein